MLTNSSISFNRFRNWIAALAHAVLLLSLSACASVDSQEPVALETKAVSQVVQDEVGAEAEGESDPQADIASAVPDTDIFVFRIDPSDSHVVTSFVANVTARAGYDNQPGYIPGTNDILFSSILDGRQSDVYNYVESSGALVQKTTTDVSEYSPTPLRQGGFSAVVVEADGTQRLWRYNDAGKAQEPVRGDLTGVGYHAWLENDQLALFIVDEPLMHLDVAGVNDKSRYTLAVNPGRSLHARPGTNTLSFVQHREGELSRLMNWDGEKITRLVNMPEKVEDMTWLPDGRAITVSNGKLLTWSAGSDKWDVVKDLSAYLPGEVTRLAINDAATRLAVVSSMDVAAGSE